MKERVLPHYLIELHIVNGGFANTNKFDFKIKSEKNITSKTSSNKSTYLFICLELET